MNSFKQFSEKETCFYVSLFLFFSLLFPSLLLPPSVPSSLPSLSAPPIVILDLNAPLRLQILCFIFSIGKILSPIFSS